MEFLPFFGRRRSLGRGKGKKRDQERDAENHLAM